MTRDNHFTEDLSSAVEVRLNSLYLKATVLQKKLIQIHTFNISNNGLRKITEGINTELDKISRYALVIN